MVWLRGISKLRPIRMSADGDGIMNVIHVRLLVDMLLILLDINVISYLSINSQMMRKCLCNYSDCIKRTS